MVDNKTPQGMAVKQAFFLALEDYQPGDIIRLYRVAGSQDPGIVERARHIFGGVITDGTITKYMRNINASKKDWQVDLYFKKVRPGVYRLYTREDAFKFMAAEIKEDKGNSTPAKVETQTCQPAGVTTQGNLF